MTTSVPINFIIVHYTKMHIGRYIHSSMVFLGRGFETTWRWVNDEYFLFGRIPSIKQAVFGRFNTFCFQNTSAMQIQYVTRARDVIIMGLFVICHFSYCSGTSGEFKGAHQRGSHLLEHQWWFKERQTPMQLKNLSINCHSDSHVLLRPAMCADCLEICHSQRQPAFSIRNQGKNK